MAGARPPTGGTTARGASARRARSASELSCETENRRELARRLSDGGDADRAVEPPPQCPMMNERTALSLDV